MESTSRKYRVPVATLTEWRARFLAGGEIAVKSREADVEDEEKRRLKSVVASISVENELLRQSGGWLPFGIVEVETMSRSVSPSTHKPYGVARVVAVWNLARSNFYAARQRERDPRQAQKRGPKVLSDVELIAEIRKLQDAPVFAREGYWKICARLRHNGVRTSKDRVLRLLREHELLSPARQPEPGAANPQVGTIVTEAPDQMCGTDATATSTEAEGTVTIFAAIDHCAAECVGIHVVKEGDALRSARAHPPGRKGAFRLFQRRHRRRHAVAP